MAGTSIWLIILIVAAGVGIGFMGDFYWKKRNNQHLLFTCLPCYCPEHAAAGGSKRKRFKECGRWFDAQSSLFQRRRVPNMNMSLNCNSSWGSYLFVGKCDISVFNISSTV